MRTNKVAVILIVVLTGCSSENPQEGPVLRRPIVSSFGENITQIKDDTTYRNVIPETLQSAPKEQGRPEKKTFEYPVVEKLVLTKPIKKSVKSLSQNSLQVEDALPATMDEVIARAKVHYEKAKKLAMQGDDSALVQVNRSIELYEDGSSFALKAEILLSMKAWNDAANAAERALVQKNEWEKSSHKKAIEIMCYSIDSLNRMFPSIITQKRLERAKDRYANYY